MLSKAIRITPLSSKILPKFPLSQFRPKSAQPLAPSSLSIPNIPKYPRYYFSNTQSKEKLSVDQDKAPSEQDLNDKEDSSAEGREDFVEFMQKKLDFSNVNYEYSSKTIFEVSSNKEDFTRRYLFYSGMGAVWFGVSYLTFNFINPWIAIIPAWFLAGSLMTIRMSAKFSMTMVKKIELVDNAHIKIYPLSLKGKDIQCSIQDTEILGIKVMSASPQHKKTESSTKSYIIMANFTETEKKKTHNRMRLIVDAQLTTIPNLDLLKNILHGEVDEVAKYKYVEKSEQAKKEEEEKKQGDKLEDATGKAKLEIEEDQFEQLKRELKKGNKQQTKAEKEK